MAVYAELHDGRRLEFPDGTDPSIIQSTVKKVLGQSAPAEKSGGFAQQAGNLAAGLVRGAGSIGATLLAPIDIAKDALDGKGLSLDSNRQRRAAMDGGLRELGADTDSIAYQGGKLVGEIAGTAGAGGVVANGVRAVAPGATGFANAVATGGFRAGATPGVANAATRVAGGAVNGGVTAAMVDPTEAKDGAVIGAVLPGAAAVAGKVGRKVGGALRGDPASPEVAALAHRAAELGIRVPADRLVDSKPMNALASLLNYVPFSGRAGVEDAMVSQLNRRLSNTFGQDSSNVTASLRKADDALGGQFDDFLKSNTVRMDSQFLDDLAETANTAGRELGTDGARIIGNQVDEIISKAADGVIDGQAAYNIKKTLDKIGKRNSPEAAYALDLKRRLMDALDRSVGQQKAEAFAGLRKQYGNMLELQKLATNGAEGEISVSRLANLKNIRNSEMQELADIAAQFVKPRESQHSSAQRAVAGLAGLTMGGVGGLAAGATAGRSLNSLLNSDIARRAALGQPGQSNRLLELIQQSGYRAAPVLSAQ